MKEYRIAITYLTIATVNASSSEEAINVLKTNYIQQDCHSALDNYNFQIVEEIEGKNEKNCTL